MLLGYYVFYCVWPAASEEDDYGRLWHERLAQRFSLRILRGWTMGTLQIHMLEGQNFCEEKGKMIAPTPY